MPITFELKVPDFAKMDAKISEMPKKIAEAVEDAAYKIYLSNAPDGPGEDEHVRDGIKKIGVKSEGGVASAGITFTHPFTAASNYGRPGGKKPSLAVVETFASHYGFGDDPYALQAIIGAGTENSVRARQGLWIERSEDEVEDTLDMIEESIVGMVIEEVESA